MCKTTSETTQKNVDMNVQCKEFPNCEAQNKTRQVDTPLKSISQSSNKNQMIAQSAGL